MKIKEAFVTLGLGLGFLFYGIIALLGIHSDIVFFEVLLTVTTNTLLVVCIGILFFMLIVVPLTVIAKRR